MKKQSVNIDPLWQAMIQADVDKAVRKRKYQLHFIGMQQHTHRARRKPVTVEVPIFYRDNIDSRRHNPVQPMRDGPALRAIMMMQKHRMRTKSEKRDNA